jgi:hypothetical protein
MESELGNIAFKAKSSKLTREAKKTLDSLAVIINNHPNCVVFAKSLSDDGCFPKDKPVNWERTAAVLSYLAKRGIAGERLVFVTSANKDLNLVNLTLGPDLSGEHW